MSTTNEATEVVGGLNAIGDIKQKIHILERFKDQIEEQLMMDEREQVRIVEYRQELEKLQEEKLAHVAELRLIHSDIDVMEGTIKQAESERSRNIGQLHALYGQYVPLLTQINFLRLSLGLTCLQDETLHVKLNNDTLGKLKEFEAEQRAAGQSAMSLFSNDLQRQLAAGTVQPVSVQPSFGADDDTAGNAMASNESADARWKLEVASSPHQQQHATSTTLDSSDNANTVVCHSISSMPLSAAQPAVKQTSFTNVPLANVPQLMHSTTAPTPSLGDTASNSQLPPVSFGAAQSSNLSLQAASLCRMIRQQTPPMKACSSCQQQIHRNAPICPLCKARSRSQHSKRASPAKRSKPPQ